MKSTISPQQEGEEEEEEDGEARDEDEGEDDNDDDDDDEEQGDEKEDEEDDEEQKEVQEENGEKGVGVRGSCTICRKPRDGTRLCEGFFRGKPCHQRFCPSSARNFHGAFKMIDGRRWCQRCRGERNPPPPAAAALPPLDWDNTEPLSLEELAQRTARSRTLVTRSSELWVKPRALLESKTTGFIGYRNQQRAADPRLSDEDMWLRWVETAVAEAVVFADIKNLRIRGASRAFRSAIGYEMELSLLGRVASSLAFALGVPVNPLDPKQRAAVPRADGLCELSVPCDGSTCGASFVKSVRTWYDDQLVGGGRPLTLWVPWSCADQQFRAVLCRLWKIHSPCGALVMIQAAHSQHHVPWVRLRREARQR